MTVKELSDAVIHIRIPKRWKEICKKNASQHGFATMSLYCAHLIKVDEFYYHSAWPKGARIQTCGAILSDEEFMRKLAYDKAFEESFKHDADYRADLKIPDKETAFDRNPHKYKEEEEIW